MNNAIAITVFCQYNPLSSSASGGIGALIRSYIYNAPPEFDFAVVGVSDDLESLPPLRWQKLAVAGRPFRFLPLFYEGQAPGALPLGVRFSQQVWHHRTRLELQGRILHFHRPEPAVALRSVAAPRFLFIHNSVGDPAGPFKQRLEHWSNGLLENVAVPAVSQVYAVRETLAADLRRRYPDAAERIAFMPTWVDADRFRPLPPLQRALHKQRYVAPENRLIVFVGRLEAQKDLLLLLSVFEKLYAQRQDVRLLLCGEGSLRPQLERVIASRGLHGVQLLGNVPYEQVPSLLAAADLMLLTSRYEGMPVAVLEALACGVPVVSTDVGEVRRVLSRGGGRLMASREAAEIAAAVGQVLDFPPPTEECLQAVAPFTAENVLAPIYQLHRVLQASQGRTPAAQRVRR